MLLQYYFYSFYLFFNFEIICINIKIKAVKNWVRENWNFIQSKLLLTTNSQDKDSKKLVQMLTVKEAGAPKVATAVEDKTLEYW